MLGAPLNLYPQEMTEQNFSELRKETNQKKNMSKMGLEGASSKDPSLYPSTQVRLITTTCDPEDLTPSYGLQEYLHSQACHIHRQT